MTDLTPHQLNIADAARYLGTSRSSIYRRVADGRLTRDPITHNIDVVQLQTLKRSEARKHALAGLKRNWRRRTRPLRRVLRNVGEVGRRVLSLTRHLGLRGDQ